MSAKDTYDQNHKYIVKPPWEVMNFMAYSMYWVNETYVVSAESAVSTKRVHLTNNNESKHCVHIWNCDN